MFYSNKDVVDRINKTFNDPSANRGGQLNNLPKEMILERLNQREPIKLFYMVYVRDNVEIPYPIEQPIPFGESPGVDYNQYTIALKQLFFYPLGNMIWSDDKTLDIFDELGIFDQKIIDTHIAHMYICYTHGGVFTDPDNPEDPTEAKIAYFVQKLNRR